jgi:hypothetical protein
MLAAAGSESAIDKTRIIFTVRIYSPQEASTRALRTCLATNQATDPARPIFSKKTGGPPYLFP